MAAFSEDRFPWVDPDGEAARNWRQLRARGDEVGLRRLEKRLEETESQDEVERLKFCSCGCGRLDFSEAAIERGELIERRIFLPDGGRVVETPDGMHGTLVEKEGE